MATGFMPISSLKTYFFFLAILLLLCLMALLWYLKVNPIIAYLMSISVATIFFYGYDKNRAKKNKIRVPEIVLHLLAVAGGTPGALLGQILFRHKTKKWRFRVVFILILILQVVGIVVYC